MEDEEKAPFLGETQTKSSIRYTSHMYSFSLQFLISCQLVSGRQTAHKERSNWCAFPLHLIDQLKFYFSFQSILTLFRLFSAVSFIGAIAVIVVLAAPKSVISKDGTDPLCNFSSSSPDTGPISRLEIDGPGARGCQNAKLDERTREPVRRFPPVRLWGLARVCGHPKRQNFVEQVRV